MEFQETIKAARDGDLEVFESLYQLSYPELFKVCIRFFSDSGLIEQILQDSYVTIFKEMPFAQNQEEFLAWCQTIVRGQCIAQVTERFLGKAVTPGKEDREHFPDRTAEIFAGGEEAQRCYSKDEIEFHAYQILSAVPEFPRACLVLWAEGKTEDEIASILSVTVPQVRTNLKIAEEAITRASAALPLKGYAQNNTSAVQNVSTQELLSLGLSVVCAFFAGYVFKGQIPAFPEVAKAKVIAGIGKKTGQTVAKNASGKASIEGASGKGVLRRMAGRGTLDSAQEPASSAVSSAVKTAGRFSRIFSTGFLHTMAGKIVIGVTAAALVAGVAGGAYAAHQAKNEETKEEAGYSGVESAETLSETSYGLEEGHRESRDETSAREDISSPNGEEVKMTDEGLRAMYYISRIDGRTSGPLQSWSTEISYDPAEKLISVTTPIMSFDENDTKGFLPFPFDINGEIYGDLEWQAAHCKPILNGMVSEINVSYMDSASLFFNVDESQLLESIIFATTGKELHINETDIFRYNANGQLVETNARNFMYDTEGRLSTETNSLSGDECQYHYDEEGRISLINSNQNGDRVIDYSGSTVAEVSNFDSGRTTLYFDDYGFLVRKNYVENMSGGNSFEVTSSYTYTNLYTGETYTPTFSDSNDVAIVFGDVSENAESKAESESGAKYDYVAMYGDILREHEAQNLQSEPRVYHLYDYTGDGIKELMIWKINSGASRTLYMYTCENGYAELIYGPEDASGTNAVFYAYKKGYLEDYGHMGYEAITFHEWKEDHFDSQLLLEPDFDDGKDIYDYTDALDVNDIVYIRASAVDDWTLLEEA